MAHPYMSEVKRSQKRRLGYLGAKAGKSFGAAEMEHKTSYPKKRAGTQREFTISGKNARPRADRMASGGAVGRKRKPSGHTTNIIVSHAGGAGGRGGGFMGAAPGAVPPIRRPMLPGGPPVGGGIPPVGGLPGGMPIGGMPVGGMPMGAGMMPPIARAPIGAPIGAPAGGALAPGVRPPGMKRGGQVKKRNGGDVDAPDVDDEDQPAKTPSGKSNSDNPPPAGAMLV